jgi:hypothetical protein
MATPSQMLECIYGNTRSHTGDTSYLSEKEEVVISLLNKPKD